MHALRCSVCDRTNDINVVNLPGGYIGQHRRAFSQDESNPHLMICFECKAVVEDTKREFFIDVDEDRENENEG